MKKRKWKLAYLVLQVLLVVAQLIATILSKR